MKNDKQIIRYLKYLIQRRLGHATLDMTSTYVNPPLTTDSAPHDLMDMMRELHAALANHRAQGH
jgi:integrase